ncbi:hypothetical protein P3L10_019189 [Capsicum annuum]
MDVTEPILIDNNNKKILVYSNKMEYIFLKMLSSAKPANSLLDLVIVIYFSPRLSISLFFSVIGTFSSQLVTKMI